MRLFLLAMLLLTATVANAVPARRYWHTMTLADGTPITVTLTGDEHLHYYIDKAGNAYDADSTGTLHPVKTSQMKTRRRRAMRRIEGLRKAQQMNPINGQRKTLLILVNFQDQEFSSSLSNGNPNATFNAICNEVGYTNSNGAIGSVHDYFHDQSYGNFDLHFDVVGPVTVSRNYSYYGNNDSYNNDAHADDMVREACELVKDSVNFANYDWDGDGTAEQVIIIYAGYGEATDGGSSTIWPHQFNLQYTYGGTVEYDGVTIDSYLALNERVRETYGSGTIRRSRDVLSGMGTLCHEYSHSLGLMDHYDVNYSGNYGMGSWDLMCSGSYNGPNNNGWVPASMTSYERMFLGWLTPTELYSKPDTVTAMPALQDSPVAYIIYNKNHTNEYFMLENKSQNRWDSYLPNSGMLVLHVDYKTSRWEDNTINTGDEQHMTIIPADDDLNADSETTDTYPRGTDKGLTSNNLMLNNRGDDGTYRLHCSVTNIKENGDGTMSFIYSPDPAVTLGINKISVSSPSAGLDPDAPRYNLAGQRVGADYRGIVIQNGRKFLTF